MTKNSVPLENSRSDAGMTKAGSGAGLSWNVVQCRLDKRGGDLDPSATRQQDTIQKKTVCERQGPWVVSASAGFLLK